MQAHYYKRDIESLWWDGRTDVEKIVADWAGRFRIKSISVEFKRLRIHGAAPVFGPAGVLRSFAMLNIMRIGIAVIITVSSAVAQVVPAGGKWIYRAERDKMTDGYWHTFTLKADEDIADGILRGTPELTITCGKTWRDSQLTVPVISDSDSIEVRADGKQHSRFWPVAEDHKTFFVDGHDWVDMRRVPATKDILKSSDVRIKFSAYPGHSFVIRFSPAGINRTMLDKACGDKFEKM